MNEKLLGLAHHSLHFELIGKLENVQYNMIRDRNSISIRVDQMEKVDKLLVDNILDFHFLLSLLIEMSEEQSLEVRRVESEKLFAYVEFVLSDLQNHIAHEIGSGELGWIHRLRERFRLRVDDLHADFNRGLASDNVLRIRQSFPKKTLALIRPLEATFIEIDEDLAGSSPRITTIGFEQTRVHFHFILPWIVVIDSAPKSEIHLVTAVTVGSIHCNGPFESSLYEYSGLRLYGREIAAAVSTSQRR
ncbi:hypothetical protein PENTCL1PPCAC_10068, partial [Pristionchus entomophagus]